MSRGLVAEIDLSALRANYQRVGALSAGAKICAVVKANAYGHGMERVAQTLDKADLFAVTSLEEGLKLRSYHILQPILLLEGVFSEADLTLALDNNFHLVIHCQQQLDLLSRVLKKNKFTHSDAVLHLWLKLDSGMGRLGFRSDQYKKAYSTLINDANIANMLKELVLMTHLACADQPNHEKNAQQLSCYEQVLTALDDYKSAIWQGPSSKSVANSGALFHDRRLTYDWIRPGISLYGGSPLCGVTPFELGLAPVMTLKSRIIALKTLSKGDTVGYGATFKAQDTMHIGILAVGYGDGYPRIMKKGTPVLINNLRSKLIGRVSMDMIAVDVSHLPEVSLGDEAILWGSDLLADEVAPCAATISYELFCNIAQRVPLKYINDLKDDHE